jgi:hypothetical protein
MKRIICSLILAGLISGSFSYSLYGSAISKTKDNNTLTGSEFTQVPASNCFNSGQRDSSLRKVTGSSRLEVLESLEGDGVTETDANEPAIVIKRYQDERYRDREERERSYGGARSFRGHLTGIEFGLSNYRYNNSMTLPDDISYMNLNTSCSNAFNITFSQLNMGFSRNIGIVTGIGLNWDNYRFEYRNSITVGPDGLITEYIPDNPVPVKRSKFSVLYLNVPALLEIQIPAGYQNHLNVAAGIVGGLKLNAWTKVVYDDKEKARVKGDYNLNMLRAGFTARAGYRNFMIYGTYYFTPWFQDLRGPGGYNLEPFEIGIALTFND